MLFTLSTNVTFSMKWIWVVSASVYHPLLIISHSTSFYPLSWTCFYSCLKLMSIYFHTIHILTYFRHFSVACHQLSSLLEPISLILHFSLLIICVYLLRCLVSTHVWFSFNVYLKHYMTAMQGNKMSLSDAYHTSLDKALSLIGQRHSHLLNDHVIVIPLTFTLEVLLHFLTFVIHQLDPYYISMFHLQKTMSNT